MNRESGAENAEDADTEYDDARPQPGALRLDADTRARHRAAIMRKGAEIAQKLSDVLAGKGKRIDVQSLPALAGKPGMKPEERLRAFLDHLERCRQLIDDRDDRYGRCGVCGQDLGAVALTEMPWADRCQAHAARPG